MATAIVAISFACFCADVLGAQSSRQVEAIDRSAPVPAVEQRRERAHGQLREVVDDADDVLVGPLAGAVHSNDPLIARGGPALLAVLLYGVVLRWLANRLGSRTLGSPPGSRESRAGRTGLA